MEKEIIKKTQEVITTFKHGALTLGNRGYKFRYYDFINVAYLYLHGVDGSTPDLLDPDSDNSFIADFIGPLNKINEQTRIDLKETGFIVESDSELAEFIAKAANRSVLTGKDNNWTEEQERTTDDANWYGSGYKKIWHVDGIQKHRNLDPWAIIWDLHDFKKSDKIERLNKRVKDVLKKEHYNAKAKIFYKNKYKDELETRIDLYQHVTDDMLYIIDIEEDFILYKTKRPKGLHYVKYDHEKRRGFPDAPGRGMFEKVLNIIVQSNVARKRIEAIQEITSNLVFAKIKDGDGDKIVNRKFQNLKTGLVIPVTSIDHIPQKIDLGGEKQLVELQNKVVSMRETIDSIWNSPDVLQGEAKDLGANSSGIAIQSLAEYASSVHKDVKKRYARVAEGEYQNYIEPYVLTVFDSQADIKKFLTPTEMNVVKRNVKDSMLAMAQLEAASRGEEFNLAVESESLEEELKKRHFIPGALLDKLRENVKGIKAVISGEKASRQVVAEFYQSIKADYMVNPQIFQDPAYVALLKKTAKVYNIDELEITEFIKETQV